MNLFLKWVNIFLYRIELPKSIIDICHLSKIILHEELKRKEKQDKEDKDYEEIQKNLEI